MRHFLQRFRSLSINANGLQKLAQRDSTQEKLLLLSPAERKILSLIADEKSSKTIAELLFIAEKTVENHRSNIIRKLGLSNTKNALLIWAIENKKHIISN